MSQWRIIVGYRGNNLKPLRLVEDTRGKDLFCSSLMLLNHDHSVHVDNNLTLILHVLHVANNLTLILHVLHVDNNLTLILHVMYFM